MEDIAKYGIKIGFEDALSSLKTFTNAMSKMESARETSLHKQIGLYKELNTLIKQSSTGKTTTLPLNKPTAPQKPITPLTQDSELTQKHKDFNIVQKNLEKTEAIKLKREIAIAEVKLKQQKQEVASQKKINDLKTKGAISKLTQGSSTGIQKELREHYRAQEVEAKKFHDSELKRQKELSNLKIKGAVQGITRGSGMQEDFKAYYGAQEAEAKKLAATKLRLQDQQKAFFNKATIDNKAITEEQRKTWRIEQERANTLRELKGIQIQQTKEARKLREYAKEKAAIEKSVTSFSYKVLALNKHITKEEREQYDVQLRQVRTLDKLKLLQNQIKLKVAETTSKRQKENATLKQQHFLTQRLNASTKQLAGNYISAFAVAGTVTGATRIGQDFEAVGNTMLAVSTDSKEAGENLSFVKNEAFRLGLGLKESSKGFAKLVAARGEMSLMDTKSLFSGVSELSTLLGLTTEESGRALTAIQQMASKGTISSEELNLGSF